MDSRPRTPSGVDTSGLGPPLQPRHYRHQIHRLAYFNLDPSNDQDNGGIIRNLGEAGIAIQAVAPLLANQQIFLRFELVNPRVRVAAVGRVAWADPAGLAGVEFLALPPRSRRQLKEWMFLQLLTTSAQAIGDLNFARSKSGEEATELLFSAASRPAIRLEPEVASAVLDGKDRQKLHLILVSVWPLNARTFPAGGWVNPSVGSIAFRCDMHGDDRDRSDLAGGADPRMRNCWRLHCTLPAVVLVLDWLHARAPGWSAADWRFLGRRSLTREADERPSQTFDKSLGQWSSWPVLPSSD